ncbi:MAG: hypothetical protein BJ554DRAFT_8413 [Olpidium bornovanus]|uniref:Zinc finger PHD-type domain-containing protein n=1 Tax=Olpidium bornovanus TaxID=278681 RepID=A0A8H8DIH3_9FUNG|nr:MAG: hypothetical protein BJ554DRAFT_8413 [Olpidium bornovanus]
MIACDGCEEWFHGTCVKVSEEAAELVDKYYCPSCTREFSLRCPSGQTAYSPTPSSSSSSSSLSESPIFLEVQVLPRRVHPTGARPRVEILFAELRPPRRAPEVAKVRGPRAQAPQPADTTKASRVPPRGRGEAGPAAAAGLAAASRLFAAVFGERADACAGGGGAGGDRTRRRRERDTGRLFLASK